MELKLADLEVDFPAIKVLLVDNREGMSGLQKWLAAARAEASSTLRRNVRRSDFGQVLHALKVSEATRQRQMVRAEWLPASLVQVAAGATFDAGEVAAYGHSFEL